MTQPAYAQVDDAHLAWMFFLGGGAIGDMCAQFESSIETPPDIGYAVQRNWSNASAKAGHDPCQPSPATPAYFNAMPVLSDSLTSHGTTTQGINVPNGTSKTLELDLFSDGPTSADWTLSAHAYARNGQAPVTFTFDETTGHNGDKAMVTVTSTGPLTNSSKTATIVISSTLGARQNVWLGMLGQQ